MCTEHRKVSLGFTDEKFDAGVHICQLFSDDEERRDSLKKFLLSGLVEKEKCACFSNNIPLEEIEEHFADAGLSLDGVADSKQLIMARTDDAYLENGRFDPNRMLGLLSDYYDSARSEGWEGARLIGEMSPTVTCKPGGERLVEYEAAVNKLVVEKRITGICQYNVRDFSGAIIMDILRVHPMMIIRGSVVQNPFYKTADELFAEK